MMTCGKLDSQKLTGILFEKLFIHEHAIENLVHKMVAIFFRYTAHKKSMNAFACSGFDHNGAIISRGRCLKTLVYKSVK